MNKGKVWLVGAGPGDTALITVKGLRAIKAAEVILYDRLVNPKLLDYAPANCEFIYCGKLPDRHTLRQEAINQLLVDKASEAATVVRLKGGDPGVFGRVGEEAAFLAEHEVPYEIVPGITSGIAAAMYAGVPVTHREFGESFAVVTAHDKSADGKPALNWEGIVKGIDTVAFYMGIANLPFICEKLIEHGKAPETPVMLVQWGTYSRQKVLQGNLRNISELAVKEKFSNPSITLVGNIVFLREKLNWFEKKPLFGRQILLARSSSGESELAERLAERGADVIEFPKWKYEAEVPDEQLIKKLPDFKQILFTSPRSCNEFFQTLKEKKVDIRKVTAELYGTSSTLKAIEKHGLTGLPKEQMEIDNSVLVVGESSILAHKLSYTQLFGTCGFWITGKQQIDDKYLPLFERILQETDIDTVILPSSGSARGLADALNKVGENIGSFLQGRQTLAMGRQTAAAVYDLHPGNVAVSELPTIESIIQLAERIRP
ncbi:uroporphyrinogen-III C-methyltransferase [Bacillus sp. M6-12]|uniref:uroporphyrinogen-III C-methyltransferase n=1 Tax=Bacillus sp. M6-12 TaxID=2054166 RepID=UPI0015E13CF4|nr:uroporphyrinogen-III C-methyltransferase [Bacillus sp. M6-12]